jgi:hypothetical protein
VARLRRRAALAALALVVAGEQVLERLVLVVGPRGGAVLGVVAQLLDLGLDGGEAARAAHVLAAHAARARLWGFLCVCDRFGVGRGV